MKSKEPMTTRDAQEQPNCAKCGKPKFGPQSTICSAMIGKLQDFYCLCGTTSEPTFTIGAQPSPTASETERARELDAMVRDFCAVGAHPKSEVRRRILLWGLKCATVKTAFGSRCERYGIEKAAKFVRSYIAGDSGWQKERELLEDLADAILEIRD